MKTCRKCLKTKAETEFHVRRASPDGLAYKCRDCVNAYTKEWQARNPDAFKAWSAENAEKRSTYNREWRKGKEGERSADYRRWRQANRASVVARMAARKKVVKQAMPAWADMEAIAKVYAEAARMTALTGIRHEVDHIYPLKGKTVCGLHVETNLQILTRSENARKKNKLPEQALKLRA